MSDSVINCKFCEKGIDPYAYTTYRFVNGWERAHRSGGGTNALRARTPLDEWACVYCIDKLSKGINPTQQGTLL